MCPKNPRKQKLPINFDKTRLKSDWNLLQGTGLRTTGQREQSESAGGYERLRCEKPHRKEGNAQKQTSQKATGHPAEEAAGKNSVPANLTRNSNHLTYVNLSPGWCMYRDGTPAPLGILSAEIQCPEYLK